MTREDWSVIADYDMSQTVEVEKERWRRRSIYKLPECVTNINPKAFTPQVVSFGPFHCNNQNLKLMEEHKERALLRFLKRSGVTQQQCSESLTGIVKDLMDSYDSLDDEFKQNPKAFLELLILDGCFMLEIFRSIAEELPDYAANDPIFSQHGKLYVIPHIKRDMLILENQLPMMLLHGLYKLQRPSATELNLNELVFQFLFPGSNHKVPSASLHILDMYRKGMLNPSEEGLRQTKCFPICDCVCDKEAGDDIIRSAVELKEAGIKIKKSHSKFLNDVRFEKGKLWLPNITVDDLTEPLFRNLIAFERFHVGAGNDVTDYVYFIDNLIDDPQDVKLLHYNEIIQNSIGSDEAAAKLFNSLSIDITLDRSRPLSKVYERINAYCKTCWHRNRATCCHKYCSSPWSCISIFAAIFLFALTILQSVYSILAYYN